MAAIATLFSAFTTPMLAALFATGLYVLGHLSRDLRGLGKGAGSALIQHGTAFLHRVLPDLDSFDLTLQAVHQLPVTASDLWLPLAYGAGYITILLSLAAWIFERRDFR